MVRFQELKKFVQNQILNFKSIKGSFSYAGLRSLGVSAETSMLIMLIVPLFEGFAFWVILRNPCNIPKKDSESEFKVSPDDFESNAELNVPTTMTLGDKIRYIPELLRYMLPLSLVYLFEYFINQGLVRINTYIFLKATITNLKFVLFRFQFELVYFKGIWLDQGSQYRWLQVDYQIGVFISRSSVNLLKISKIWLMAVFQLINVALFLVEVATFISPSIWIVFVVVLWEGLVLTFCIVNSQFPNLEYFLSDFSLLGGGAYVNTFYRMSKEVPEHKRKFALGIVTLADAFGIALAGVIAMPTHNAFCRLPTPIRN